MTQKQILSHYQNLICQFCSILNSAVFLSKRNLILPQVIVPFFRYLIRRIILFGLIDFAFFKGWPEAFISFRQVDSLMVLFPIRNQPQLSLNCHLRLRALHHYLQMILSNLTQFHYLRKIQIIQIMSFNMNLQLYLRNFNLFLFFQWSNSKLPVVLMFNHYHLFIFRLLNHFEL